MDELAGGLPAQFNVLTDAAGSIRVRPGIAAYDGFPAVPPTTSPVVQVGAWGIYLIYVTEDRRIWALSAGVVTALSDATVTTQLDGGLRPVIVATRTRVVIAGGGKPQKWEGVGLSSRLGGSPPALSHITTIAQRLVGNASDTSGLIYWSGIGDTGAETWLTGLNFREAETKQDRCTGLYVNSNELVALGPETVQMLSPDPSEVFTNARTIDIGWGPSHSYIPMDEMFMGMDSRRRIVLSTGRAFQVVSSPSIGEQLSVNSIPDASDCFGLRYQFGNYDLAIFRYPTDGRTFVYDAASKRWSQWAGYDVARGGLGGMEITSSFFWADQQVTLVGLSDGTIAKLDHDVSTDLGEPIVVQMTSTFETRGTARLKKCDHVRLMFKRGIDAVGGTNVLEYSYRDDGGAFCEPFRLSIGDPSDVQPVVSIDSLGTYRVRQHRIVVNSVAFRFAGMEEDFGILGS